MDPRIKKEIALRELDYTKRTPLKDSEVALLFAAMVIVFVGVSVLVHGH